MSTTRKQRQSAGQTPYAPLYGYSGYVNSSQTSTSSIPPTATASGKIPSSNPLKEHNFDEMFDIFFEDGVLDDMNFSSTEPFTDINNFDHDDFGDGEDEDRNKPKNDLDKNERRERNREHAKRSRVRKKMIQESLQKSVDLLQDENNKLKAAIVQYLGADALPTTDRSGGAVASSSPVPSTNDSSSNSLGHPTSKTTSSLHYNLVKALQTAQQNFTITDPSLPDNPIIYASHGFLTLTGYALDQVLGRNCRFLQGAQTDPRAVDSIRHGLKNGLDTTTVILNYRYDGTPFWNQLFIGPLKDSNGNVVNYLGVQCKVSDLYAEAFLKTPNTSTLSVANIDAIYSSIMNIPATSESFMTPDFPSVSFPNSSLTLPNEIASFKSNSDLSLPTLPLDDELFQSSHSLQEIFSNPSQIHEIQVDPNQPSDISPLDSTDDLSRLEANQTSSASSKKSKRSRNNM